MKTKINTQYCNEEVTFKWSKYPSGQHALQLFGIHGPEMTVTVNVPDKEIAKDEIVVKDYSENYGIYSELVRLDVIESGFTVIPSGYIDLLLCKLKINPDEH